MLEGERMNIDQETIGAVSKQDVENAIGSISSTKWKELVEELSKKTYESTLRIIITYLGIE